mgnify:CR=1 FL=1|jgi:hypothetical protein
MPPYFLSERNRKMSREKFVQRMYRVFTDAGYSAIQMLTVSAEEMVEIPNITIPEIRAVMYIQKKYSRGEFDEMIKREVKRCERRKADGRRL